MKKRFSILLFVATFIFGILSFSTDSLAVEGKSNGSIGEIVTESDTLYEPQLVPEFDNEKEYAVGEIIVESDTLYNSEFTNTVTNNNEANKTITPYGFYLYKNKTITAYYPSISTVTETRYYEEYDGGYWYKGNLKLMSVVASGNGYTATFSGKLSAWVE
ncbi:hypothetical protein [Lysinibacillus piscis]|uniref:DUF5626 domain-containing protein n=1 Tax=Lysinibacillus piscis TaxID=2518931 RepID=A0ABQ5NLF4_9BACI|nr:hypothetical protein [Lysinibacillus sp. KH24]GLC89185.1 hypothetical protein LYSBPC_23120 [Lysinibacillus sp. KH24]